MIGKATRYRHIDCATNGISAEPRGEPNGDRCPALPFQEIYNKHTMTYRARTLRFFAPPLL